MSDMENSVQVLSDRLKKHEGSIATEEAVKTSVVLPFLQALGYEVFNPGEVIPEFTADTPGKRGEKVDYAIALDGDVKILIECKPLSVELDVKHLSQLYRYFSVTNAKFGLLTNGRFFQFFTDLEEPNKLDKKPFFSFDLLDYSSNSLAELKKFEKSSFDVEGILANAERLKYTSAVKRFLVAQMEEPLPSFVQSIAKEVHDGRVTAQIRDMVGLATKSAFREIVRDAVQSRLSSALESSDRNDTEEVQAGASDGIVTTEAEIEATMVIRAIVRAVIDAKRVSYRDSKSYCAVLVDDNNRKPLARLHFNRKQKYLGLFDKVSEERMAIDDLNDIYRYSDRLRKTAEQYTL